MTSFNGIILISAARRHPARGLWCSARHAAAKLAASTNKDHSPGAQPRNLALKMVKSVPSTGVRKWWQRGSSVEKPEASRTPADLEGSPDATMLEMTRQSK